MKIEVMDFYPLERNEEKDCLTGTLRIKLPDIGIHLLGIFVSKTKDSWRFTLPGRKGTHHETGESVRYPLISFEDREKQKELIAAIYEDAPAFIESRISDKENPLIFSEKKQQSEKKKKPKSVEMEKSKGHDNEVPIEMASSDNQKLAKARSSNAKPSVLVKKRMDTLNQKTMQSIAAKEWVDPPKRKEKQRLKR